jgi:DNA-binding NtrC family response regulator
MNNQTNISKKIKIFIVDDDEFSLENLSLSLDSTQFNITTTGNSEEALQLLTNNTYDIAILDLKLQGTTGLEIIEKTKDDKKLTKFILITGYSEEEAFIKANRIGVDDILKKPYDEFQLHSTINRLIHIKSLEEENIAFKEKIQKENIVLKEQFNKSFDSEQNIMVGESLKLKDALNKAKSVAEYSINTLIVGETGTGKELLARYIQRNSARHNNPFVPVNCAALTESLFESELFGYEKGAFTNALQSHAGLFEVANGGILFLDEITEIPILLQAKLLRVIEEGIIKRVGSTKEIRIDVHILSSTNRNIHKAIKKGFLREDLYHRIGSTVIELPPLRDRRDDLHFLTNHFQNLYCGIFGKEKLPFPDEVLEYINNSPWDGNIREFSNFIKNYIIFGTITKNESYTKSPLRSDAENTFVFRKCNFEELEEAKFWLIEKTLKKYDGNKTLTAKHLGISYQGLAYLLKNLY